MPHKIHNCVRATAHRNQSQFALLADFILTDNAGNDFPVCAYHLATEIRHLYRFPEVTAITVTPL